MKLVPNGVSRKVARQILVVKKNSPTTMFVGGLVGVGVTVVLACRATLKLEEVLSETKANLETASTLKHSDYSEEDRKKDKAYIYVRSVVSLVKLYAPATAVGVVSVTLLAGSHSTLSKRNAGLLAAYAAAEKGFAEYRERVLADVGEEKEREYQYDMESCEIEDENGKKKTIKRVAKRQSSIYGRFFDNNSSSWSPTPEYNVVFLRCQQNYFNDRLVSKGHVFLNEVYDALGMERSSPGALVGWVRDNGDNYIDFGIFNTPANDQFYDFITGDENGIWLDFNVDGVIYEKI